MIKIATYNIWESPAGMPPRFVQIVNEIVNQNADIICLQEVADTKTQDELALQCQYPYFCFYPQTGLLILSRLPIEAYNKGDHMEGNRKGAGK
ncbi:MAG: endonuclease/exonuclease/phosphatase family protein [Lachnospiraceae bacterium]|nr:endonuclease/exonuclease/phosphatase family protein [Lachnospiraceae bacterium]